MAEITGTDIFEVASDALTALITALIATQASAGDDPAISYVYQRSAPAKLLLNAATVSLLFAEPSQEMPESSTGKQVVYEMRFALRVHTGYLPNGIRDDQKTMRLLNSVLNKCKANISLGSGQYIARVTDIEPSLEFPESGTFGGQAIVVLTRGIVHTQE